MPSALTAARAALENAVAAAWVAGGYAAGALSFDNTVAAEPDPSWSVWARCTLMLGRGELLTMGPVGTGANEVVGILQVSLFGRKQRGTGALYAAAAVVRAALGRRMFGTVQTFVPSAPERAGDEDPSLVQVIVCVPVATIETQ